MSVSSSTKSWAARLAASPPVRFERSAAAWAVTSGASAVQLISRRASRGAGVTYGRPGKTSEVVRLASARGDEDDMTFQINIGPSFERMAALDPAAVQAGKVLGTVIRPGPLKNALTGSWLGHPLHPVLTDVVIGA